MKLRSLISLLVLVTACGQPSYRQRQMQAQIDSLQNKLNDAYKPGLGEFMNGIQIHHAKLWFAGINENWKLADFEINEIKEALDDINKYNADRPEVKSIGMIIPPIDSIETAIDQKNLRSFRNSFILLTNTCNNCHKATAHEFNVIVLPTTPPISNQEFSVSPDAKQHNPMR